MERRSHTRLPVPFEVRLKDESVSQQARISDISLGGCYVETLAQVTDNESVELSVLLPTNDWLPLRGEVKVVHPGMGFGLQFSKLPEQSAKMLVELIVQLHRS